MKTPVLYPFAGVMALWGVAFVLSCRLMSSRESEAGDTAGSVAGKWLGDSRLALSQHFYEIADEYFHMGTTRIQRQAFNNSVFQNFEADISPRGHFHLGDRTIGEIMPWLKLAVLMNPHDVQAYLIAAFWLARDAGRPDLAEEILREAQANNPFNYPIQLEKAHILMKQKQFSRAREALDAGLAFWPGDAPPDRYETRYDKADLLLYRACVHEYDGQKEQAVAALQEIRALFPERAGLSDRIRELREGKPSLLADEQWSAMVKNYEQKRSSDTCRETSDNAHNHKHQAPH